MDLESSPSETNLSVVVSTPPRIHAVCHCSATLVPARLFPPRSPFVFGAVKGEPCAATLRNSPSPSSLLLLLLKKEKKRGKKRKMEKVVERGALIRRLSSLHVYSGGREAVCEVQWYSILWSICTRKLVDQSHGSVCVCVYV